MIRKALVLLLLLLTTALLSAQGVPQQPAPPSPPQQKVELGKFPEKQAAKPETKITPEQAKQLFDSVDEILKFVSQDTGLPIKHRVKRKLADRAEVVRYVQERMKSDEDSKRLERSAVVLKKFGLVPRSFELRTFLLDLLGEQVAGYYDGKTKTVYLLDWVEPEQQKPVLAHELTHALQDQNFGLERLSKDAKKDDPTGLEGDERMAARQAVIEGQGMIVLMDYMLAPMGSSVAQQPQVIDVLQAGMTQAGPNMAVFNRAPMFLQQVLLFPYKYGTIFERDLLVRGGKQKAFAGVLENPPNDTRQVMESATYVAGQSVEPLTPPDFDKLTTGYKKWDLSIMGEFDVYLLMHQYASPEMAEVLSKEWRGGYYWAGLHPEAAKDSASEPPASSIALAYVSRWSSPDAAAQFAGAYAAALKKRYKTVQPLPGSASIIAPHPIGPESGGSKNQVKVTITVWPRLNDRAAWSTEEGDVTIEPHGDLVLVTESLDPPIARKIREAVFH